MNPSIPPTPNAWRVPVLIFKVLLLLALVLNGIRVVRHGSWYPPESPEGQRHHGTDFTAYYSAGELARLDKNIYDYTLSSTPRRPYIYPPMFAIFPMAPLSMLPHNTALAIFYACNALLLMGTLGLLRKLLWPPDKSVQKWWLVPEAGLALTLLACGRYLDSNFTLSNANLFVAFLVVAGLYGCIKFQSETDLKQRRPLDEILGGLSIALATTYKVTPGLFGLYFLWARRGWAMLGGALGLLLFLFLIPSSVFGVGLSAQLLCAFMRSAAQQAVSADTDGPASPASAGSKTESIEVGWSKAASGKFTEESGAVGISLRGTLQKILSPVSALEDHSKDGYANTPEARRINIMNLTLAQARGIALLLSGLLLLGTILLTASEKAQADAFALALSWSLVCVTMLLISPLTRKAHCVVLLLPCAVLCAGLQREWFASKWLRKGAWVAVISVVLAGTLTSPDLVGDYWSDYLHSAGCHTLALLVLYAALAGALWERRKPTMQTETIS